MPCAHPGLKQLITAKPSKVSQDISIRMISLNHNSKIPRRFGDVAIARKIYYSFGGLLTLSILIQAATTILSPA